MTVPKNGIQVLDPGVGYGIVVGIGIFFALMISGHDHPS
jgi:hypothetical protein